ncbi:hypothetical protein Q3G72_012431 [Acer saccharum]|nr:hypothetical protein Q3G72_012431 [Acer saccharum]
MEDPKQYRPRVKKKDLIGIVSQHGGMANEDSGLGLNVGTEICSFDKYKPLAVDGPWLVGKEIGPMNSGVSYGKGQDSGSLGLYVGRGLGVGSY